MHSGKKIVGTLLPLFALPQPEFISGQKFLEWLQKTGQSAWLLLPLHETQLEQGSAVKHVPSPYKSYGIGIDPRYHSGFVGNDETAKEAFIQKHAAWIHDYALFCSLRNHFGTDDWSKWDDAICQYDSQAVKLWAEKLHEKIDFYITQQWQLHETYNSFHSKAKRLGISLIGDLPYYPSFRSPLVWAHQEAFQIAKDGSLARVSGIPNTQTTHFGRQVWGHPLYNWDSQKEQVLKLWRLRLSYLATIFDHIRFDHAKAFFAYGEMDVKNPENDTYRDGPGREVFKDMIEYAQKQGLAIFAEDSGDKTDDLRRMLQEISIPGLRIFRFALKNDGVHKRYGDIKNYPANCVAYTTTHDTETLLAYIHSLPPEQKQQLSEACDIPYTTDKAFSAAVRNAIVASAAAMVIIPIQDWLLTTDRINVPGTEKEVGDTNWHFKLKVPVAELPVDILSKR